VFCRASRKREPPRIDKGVDGIHECLRAECECLIERRINILGSPNIQRLDFDAKFLKEIFIFGIVEAGDSAGDVEVVFGELTDYQIVLILASDSDDDISAAGSGILALAGLSYHGPQAVANLLKMRRAAALFGLSVPAGKALLTATDPWLLAGLLYLGSGVSLGAYRLAQRFLAGGRAGEARLARGEWPWLAAAIFTGGVIAPVLLMFGLSRAAAAEAALMLNLEGVFTAVVAWVVFREHVNRRIAGGMVAIAAGAMVLAWNPTEAVRLSGDAGPTHRGLMNLFTWFHLLSYKLQVAGYRLQVAAAGSRILHCGFRVLYSWI